MQSKLKITFTNSNLDDKNIKTLKETFIYTLIRQNIELKKKYDEPLKPLFEFNNEIKLDSFDIFKNSLNTDFTNCKGIYLNKLDFYTNSNLKISIVDFQHYKNQLNKIIIGNINSYIQNDFNSFIGNNFIENRRNINSYYLDTIFKPNKAS